MARDHRDRPPHADPLGGDRADHPPGRPGRGLGRLRAGPARMWARSSSAPASVRADGTVIYVLAQGAPVLDEAGSVSGYVGITTDITEMVELSAAQHRSDERFRNLIAKAPMGQTVVTLDGHDHRGQPRLRRARRAAPPRTWSAPSALALVHPDDRDSAIEMAAKLLRGEVEADRARTPPAATPTARRCGCRSATTLERDADRRALDLLRPRHGHLRAQGRPRTRCARARPATAS